MNIFEILNPNDNTILSNLNNSDLYTILLQINNYLIEYQDTLDIDDSITFGLEIEFENANYHEIEQNLNNLNLKKLAWTKSKWITTDEISISNGGETKSPILKDKIETWKQLKIVLEEINKYAKINTASSSHIHIGKNILNDDLESYKNFIKLWATYENIIYRFGYGEYLNARPNINKFAAPLKKELDKEINKKYKTFKSLARSINNLCKNHAFNLDHLKFNCIYASEPINTLEFRVFNGTLNPIIWQNNVNFIIKLLQYCNNYNFNHDIINKRNIDNKDKFIYPIYKYHQINIKQAIELADLIFNNNLDKINFLKQYFKSYQISREYKKAKVLTK